MNRHTFHCTLLVIPIILGKMSFTSIQAQESIVEQKKIVLDKPRNLRLETAPHRLHCPKEAVVHDLQFSPDSKLLAGAFSEGLVHLWNIKTKEIESRLQNPGQAGIDRAIWVIRFSVKGDILMAGCRDSKIRLWDVRKGDLLDAWEGQDKARSGVIGLAISPNGKWCVSCCRVPTIWNLETKGNTPLGLEIWDKTKPAAKHAVFSPDGDYFATTYWFSNQILVWEAKTGKRMAEMKWEQWPIQCLAYSPNGKLIVTGDGGGHVRLWDCAKFAEICSIQAFPGSAAAVAFSPDGKYLIAGGNSGVQEPGIICIWDLANGIQVGAFRTHTHEVKTLAISPDGKWLATAGLDQAIHLYDFTEIIKKR